MRVSVVGAGIVGLSCAWMLTERGHDVTVRDPAPGRGASYAAAGMIAPAGEAWYGEEALLRLGITSAALWPAFAAGLGTEVDFRSSGTVLAARDASDLAVLRRSTKLLASHDVPVEEVSRRELRALEPTLSDRVAGGALLPGDRQVNPRRVVDALLARLGPRVLPERVVDVSAVAADVVVLCTGTATLHPALDVIHPVRGEVLRVRSDDPPTYVVRGLVHGQQVYVVPRAAGELVVGATSESHPGPPEPTVGGVVRMLEAGRALLPSLDTATVLEVLARDRPGTPDNGPLIGEVSSPGPRVVVATGHYRHGVLLAPVTAATVRALVEGTPPPPEAAPFHPSRFSSEDM